MRDIHLSRELLRAVSRQELPPLALIEIALDHLRQLCPHCAAEWEAWESERLGKLPAPEQTLPAFPAFLTIHLPKLATQGQAAAQDFQTLLALPKDERATKIRRARTRFQNPALVRHLLDAARAEVRRDAKAAGHFAELAYQVALRISGPEPQGLLALACAEMANAARVGTERQRAVSLFTHARQIIQIGGVTDPGVIARVDHLEASLNLDQRRFQECRGLLARSHVLYSLVGGEVETVRVEITQALAYLEQGMPAAAVRTARKTLANPALPEDPHLFFLTRINLARGLMELRQLEEALEILEEDEPRHAQLNEPLMNLRYPWIRGKISSAQGDIAGAETSFRAVRDAFLEAGFGYDAALASLDLALTYVRAGRPQETQRLAEEMIAIFAAEDVHREALAALRLFQEAARKEVLGETFLVELVEYLRRARNDTTLRFEPTSLE